MASCGICLEEFELSEFSEIPCCKTPSSTKLMCSGCISNTYAVNMQKNRHNCCFCRQVLSSHFVSKMKEIYQTHFTSEERKQIEAHWSRYPIYQYEPFLPAIDLRMFIEGLPTTIYRREITQSDRARRAEASRNAVRSREIQKQSKEDADFRDSFAVGDCSDEEVDVRTYELMHSLRKQKPHLFEKKYKEYYDDDYDYDYDYGDYGNYGDY